MTINKLSILTTTASASLGNIVVSNENNDDDSLTTRQGATFDDDDDITASLRARALRSTKKGNHMLSVLQTEDTTPLMLVGTLHSSATCHLWWQQGKYSCTSILLPSYFLLATRGTKSSDDNDGSYVERSETVVMMVGISYHIIGTNHHHHYMHIRSDRTFT